MLRGRHAGKQQNVFNDFLSAAEWLFNRLDPAGEVGDLRGLERGLLVGAALTQRPSYFEAVICSYPLLDMIRYHKFLVAQVSEYGPVESKEQFRYLIEYSTYHNVAEEMAYPAMLFVTGDADTRKKRLLGSGTRRARRTGP